MTYYIFLKSLGNLEEFRKNPYVCIPSKSPCTNFQSCQKFEFQIKIRKGFITTIGPSSSFRPSRDPLPFPSQPARSPSPHWASTSWSAQPTLSTQLAARRWCPGRLPPPSRGNASPRTTLVPLCDRLTGGPTCHHLPPAPPEPGCAATAFCTFGCHSAPRDAIPVPLLPLPPSIPPLTPH
jgi:hypothetical protein